MSTKIGLEFDDINASGVDAREATPDSASWISSARVGVLMARILAVLNAEGASKEMLGSDTEYEC